MHEPLAIRNGPGQEIPTDFMSTAKRSLLCSSQEDGHHLQAGHKCLLLQPRPPRPRDRGGGGMWCSRHCCLKAENGCFLYWTNLIQTGTQFPNCLLQLRSNPSGAVGHVGLGDPQARQRFRKRAEARAEGQRETPRLHSAAISTADNDSDHSRHCDPL